MPDRLRAALYALLPGLLLALLFLFPAAAMQGVRDGLTLWANAVLPALLPFFVITSLLRDCGVLNALSPLLRPLCRLFRLPGELGGLLAAAWLSGAPNGARLLLPLLENDSLTPAQAARFVSAATVTSPLFLIGTIGAYLGGPALGALIYGIHFLCALCNGALWRGYGNNSAVYFGTRFEPAASCSPFLALPEALRSSCLSALFVGAAIAFFCAVTAVFEATGALSALERVLLFAMPADAIRPLLAGFFEISQGVVAACQAGLSLPLRASMLCALAAFGGLSVLCQAQVFLSGKVSFSLYFAQRVTHAALSFAVCRAFFLFFGGALPAFAVSDAALQVAPLHSYAVPALLLCLSFSLVPWRKTAVKTQSR